MTHFTQGVLDRSGRSARTAEAAAALSLAWLLVKAIPWRWWRWSLGVAGPLPRSAEGTGVAPLDPALRDVRLAIEAACRRLPMELVCLPRAVAMQWLLRRRGLRATLVIGVASNPSADRRFEMHAWIEHGGRIVLGEDPDRAYSPCACFSPVRGWRDALPPDATDAGRTP